MNEKVLATYLKEKRVASKLSQKDVANELGYTTPQFISNWERGVSQPPIKTLKKLGSLYKVNSQELFDVALEDTIQQVTEDLKRKFSKSKK